MSVSASTLRELHRIHRQLSDLRERKERGPKLIKAREANLARLADELAKLEAELKAARVRSDQKQLLLKTGEDKIEGLKVKLNQAASNREYQALKEQIAADQMAGSVLADEILEAMEKIDELAAHIAEQQKKIAAAKQEITKAEESVRAQAGELDQEIKRLEGELQAAEKDLPADFRETYQRLVRSKGEDAMAEAQGEFCGGCYQQLTPNNMAELHGSLAIFCRNCGRLLYSPEDRTPGAG
ncbi:MAG: phospholipase [Planctomycetota bacterium]|nr:MAG: phospholipase [Planctomycetota bacterium]